MRKTRRLLGTSKLKNQIKSKSTHETSSIKPACEGRLVCQFHPVREVRIRPQPHVGTKERQSTLHLHARHIKINVGHRTSLGIDKYSFPDFAEPHIWTDRHQSRRGLRPLKDDYICNMRRNSKLTELSHERKGSRTAPSIMLLQKINAPVLTHCRCAPRTSVFSRLSTPKSNIP